MAGVHTYRGSSEINLRWNARNELSVTIETARLHMRSIEPTEIDHMRYVALFGNKNVMKQYATGQTQTPETMQRVIAIWERRWRENDPYSGLAVFTKGTGDFVGHAILGHGNGPGRAELAGLENQGFWGNGYGREAADALVNEYAPFTIREGYLLNGTILNTIAAKARSDNPAAEKILQQLGMRLTCTSDTYGIMNTHYAITLHTHHNHV